MSELLQTEAVRASCVQWAQQRAPHIEELLHKAFLRSFGALRGYTSKSLSEQRLCKAMDGMDLPMGFSHVTVGAVEVFKPGDQTPLDTIGHHFAALGDFALCVTPGQFFDLQQRKNISISLPGDRVNIYKSIAPNLITLLPNGLAVLHGTIKEIQDQLYLKYRKSGLTYNIQEKKWM